MADGSRVPSAMTDPVAQAIARFAPELPLAVAYSGGADSTVLLHACAQRWPGQVWALHVHHGLQTAADAFEWHCRATCAALGVPLQVLRVDAKHTSGESPEDAARRARYDALLSALKAGRATGGPSSLALAHHADDQLETLLLALSRGAGLPGLSGMAERWQRDGIECYRPFLKLAAPQLRAWLKLHGVAYIDDPSNVDQRYTRNRIRARLLPALLDSLPQCRATFARSAAHAAQAQRLLDQVAAQDLAQLGLPLPIDGLRALSTERQANVLRHWCKLHCQTTPSAAQLDELLRQLSQCTTRGHQIHIKLGRGFVQRRGPVLHWYNP